MSDSSSFREFNRLPYVAKCGVIKNMDPLAILVLSQISRKSDSLVKSATKPLQFNLLLKDSEDEKSISFGYGGRMSELIIESDPRNVGATHTLRLRDSMFISFVTDQCYEDVVTIYEYDEINGFKRIIKFLVDTFGAKTVSFDFSKLQLMGHMISFTKSIGLKFEKCYAYDYDITDSDYDHIFEEFKDAPELKIRTSRYCYRAVQYHNLPLLKLKFLTIQSSCYFTLANLYSLMNCTSVQLSKLRISNQELREFVRKWMLGGCNLEYLEFNPYYVANQPPVNLPNVVRGLGAVMMEEVTMKNGDIRRFGPSRCYKFKRNDGVEATICTSWGGFF